ncbi:MAG: hypothetical protein M1826_003586 [Phylliscum demangeonii]|nr:MAG: hypothetical protein M1826_003586 [Phylliscum demangeonii]
MVTVGVAAATSASSLAPRANGDLCSLWDQRVAIVGNRLFFMGGGFIYEGGTPSTQQSLSWIYLNESFPVDVSISPEIIHSVRVPDLVPIIIDSDFWWDNTTLYLPAGWAINETANPGLIWSFNTSTDQWKELPVQGGDFNFGQREASLVASVPLYGFSFLAGGRTVPIDGMLMLDSSNGGAPMWKNLTDGDGSSGAPIPLSLEGEMVYVRAGDRGLLVTFGGYDTSHNGTQFGPGWLWDQRPMDQIAVYDIESSTWFAVTATGQIPSKRTRTCTTVSSSPDDSSFQITMYGGWDLANNTEYEEVYVLAVPAFTWIKITDVNNAEAQTGKVGRRGQKCKLWGNREMVVLGGKVTAHANGANDLNTVDCSRFPPIRVLDTTTFTWTTSFDPRPSYTVPSAVYQVIGGDGSGNATLTRLVPGNNASVLDNILSKRVPMLPDALPAAAPPLKSTPVTTPPPAKQDNHSRMGAIAGGVVGGLFLLGVVIGLLVVVHRYKRARDRTQAADTRGWMKPELSSEDAHSSRSALSLAVPGPGPGLQPQFELAGRDDDHPVVPELRSISDVSTTAPPLLVTRVHDLGVGVAEMSKADDACRVVELDSSAIPPVLLPPQLPTPPSKPGRSDVTGPGPSPPSPSPPLPSVSRP